MTLCEFIKRHLLGGVLLCQVPRAADAAICLPFVWVFYFYYVFLSLFGICGPSGIVAASNLCSKSGAVLTEFYAASQDGDNWFALHKNLK